MVRERDLQGKGPSLILGGGFLIYSRNTSNNSEVSKMASLVYEIENCGGDTAIFFSFPMFVNWK